MTHEKRKVTSDSLPSVTVGKGQELKIIDQKYETALHMPLAREYILLKYDAERDKEFHLSKKHHVSSYPTAIILNAEAMF